MRLKRVSVKRLFGLFDHTVPMDLSERVTIVHSPNGFGKTTLLQMIQSFFAGDYFALRKIVFRDFELEFDSGKTLSIVRVDTEQQVKNQFGPALDISLRHGAKQESRTTLSAPSPEAMGISPMMVERFIPFLTRLGPTAWRDQRTGSIVTFEQLLRSKDFPLPIPPEKLSSVLEPDWLRDLRLSIPVRFIESQRLLRVPKSIEARKEDEAVRPAVSVYSRELATLIKEKLAEYATLSQLLDRAFPRKLVERAHNKQAKKNSVEALTKRLQLLEDRRTSLTEAGLLDRDDENFDLASYLGDQTLIESVLPVYADDAEQKLNVFTDIAGKIELLTGIVNAHFQYKVMSIDKEKGFQFSTKYPGEEHRPRPLSPSHLSSGEQHMLVLLYELLFTVKPNSLILIDEPEISLHVAWQLEFLNDIQRITGLSGIDILIATHAPGIINDRLDVTVNLKAPGERR